MKFARFRYNHSEQYGVVTEEGIKPVTGNIFDEWEFTEDLHSFENVEILAPVSPGKVIGIGANYVASKGELPDTVPDLPVFFFKPNSSIIGPEQDVVIPDEIEKIKFESELAVVIGKEAKNLSKDQVLDHVFGYTLGNDVTAPQFFHEDGHWTVGKSFDTFTPLGPVVETELDPLKVRVRAEVNGEVKQNSPTELMIVPLKEMIAYLSTVMTLNPGDVILTGSPLGAHFVKEGDVIECKVDEIGTLRNTTVNSQTLVSS
ncbi:fumarylacetoacetate hydrolase family protein [Halobacillus naozhouensis]|uniref:Fumarylacetoacetate hydrolase family protein n=1 Tax=Halobacillus naozhouensis TaxID=554880 RepID=A0ABY8J042_9BACI|nr:fumarylacetoacetate hydrolase family protein [Halobacillus naozhouensis]WFT75868.1 fumarylacetoacetate hydrolase family protein [Halobacillus naozhouensis]